jgi:DnaK suppressor protein
MAYVKKTEIRNFARRVELRVSGEFYDAVDRMIEEALEDIDNGEYGICRQCGCDIAVKRLKANPIARHCITCKSAMENRSRLIES